MYQTVNFSAFCDAFRAYGRQDQFSYEGQQLLFDYLEELEDGTGEPIALDVIAICCDFSEESADDIAANYGIDLAGCEDADEKQEAVLHYLEGATSVVGATKAGDIVYLQF